jgi:transcriptional regulator with XRE-family HTH domain
MGVRARIMPEEVGLPQSNRRRVPGLRREEVAELTGISEDWYRWFEIGRPINVSPRLYRLAFPELYRADITARMLAAA